MTIDIDIDSSYDNAPSDSERGNWKHRLVLNHKTQTVDVRSTHGGGTPADIWNDIAIEIGQIRDGTADTALIKKYLESDLVQALLAEILDGHEIRGERGMLTDDARDTSDILDHEISELYCPSYWDAVDWLGECDADELEIAAATTDEQIDARAQQLLDEAIDNGIHTTLTGIVDYLTQVRNDLAEDAAE